MRVGPARTWFVNVVIDYTKLFSHYKEDEIFIYIKDKIPIGEYVKVQQMSSAHRQEWFDGYVEKQEKHPPEVPPRFNVNSVCEDILDLISLHLCIVSRVMHGC
jgi:hypothetical protein